jgi:hypothetical protein
MSANGTRDHLAQWRGSVLSRQGRAVCSISRTNAGAGIGTIFGRLESGHYFVNDVRETIRLGLIGGGMSAGKGDGRGQNHVDGRPLALSVLIAHAVIKAVLIGVPDDPVGKAKPAEARKPALPRRRTPPTLRNHRHRRRPRVAAGSPKTKPSGK